MRGNETTCHHSPVQSRLFNPDFQLLSCALQLVGVAGIDIQPAYLHRVAVLHQADISPFVSFSLARTADTPQGDGLIAAFQPDCHRIGGIEVGYNFIGRGVPAAVENRFRRYQLPG